MKYIFSFLVLVVLGVGLLNGEIKPVKRTLSKDAIYVNPSTFNALFKEHKGKLDKQDPFVAYIKGQTFVCVDSNWFLLVK